MDVVSPDVAHLTLVQPLPLYARIYVGPWLVAYPLAAYAFYGNYDKYIKSIGERLRRPADDRKSSADDACSSPFFPDRRG